MRRHPTQYLLSLVGVGRVGTDWFPEKRVDVYAASAVNQARKNSERLQFLAHLLDDLFLGLRDVARIDVPMESGNFRHGVFCAPLLLQRRDAIVHAPTVSVVLLCKGFG